MPFDDAIATASSRAAGFRAAASVSVRAARSGGGYFGQGSPGGAPIQALMPHGQFGNQQNSRSREQYKHFRGWDYVAIRPICTRVAAQSVCVGRVNQRRIEPQTSAERLTRLAIKESLPPSLKAYGDKIEPIEGHPALDMLENPNEYMSGWDLRYVSVASLQLAGVAYWWLDPSDPSGPRIWYIPAHWLTPVHDGKRLFVRYKIHPPNSKQDLPPIDGKNIIRFSYPDPSDPLAAFSPLQAHATATNLDEMIQGSQQAGMRNGIHPGVIITAGKLPNARTGKDERPVLTGAQRSQLITAIQLAYEGVTKHGQPAIIDGLIENITKFTNTPAEMDWTNSGKITKDRITQGYGTNPITMGHIEGVNRASAAVAEEILCSITVGPVITLFSEGMTRGIGPMFPAGSAKGVSDPPGSGSKTVIWIEQVRSHDQELRLREWEVALDHRVVTGNEFRREILNVEERPDLDELPKNPAEIAAENAPADGAADPGTVTGKPPKKKKKPLSGEPKSELEEFDEHAAERRAGRQAKTQPGKPAAKKPEPKKPAGKAGKKKSFERAYALAAKSFAAPDGVSRAELCLKAFDRRSNKLELKLAGDIAELFATQLEDVTGQLNDLPESRLGKARLVDAVFDGQSWDKLLRGVVRDHLLRGGRLGALDEYASLGQRPRKAAEGSAGLPRSVRVAIEGHVDDAIHQKYWRKIHAETRDRLHSALTKAAAESGGPKMDRLIDAIYSVLGPESSKSRAANIARTEMTGAINCGHQAAMEELAADGLIDGKRWLVFDAPGTRDTHRKNHGKVVDVDKSFTVGGHEAMWPGDWRLPAGERCRCRCTVMSVKSSERGKAIDVDENADRKSSHRMAGSDEDFTVFGSITEPGGDEKSSSPDGTKYNRHHDRLGRFASGGSGGSGRTARTSRATAGGSSQGSKSNRTAAPTSNRAKLAKKHYTPAKRDVQKWAKENEHKFAKAIGGTSDRNNAAFDGKVMLGGRVHGIELKTLTKTKNNRIIVKKTPKQRKIATAARGKYGGMHTVIIDDRDSFGRGRYSKLYSGHKMYYRRDIGAFRLHKCYRVKSIAHLKKLMQAKPEDVPKLAKLGGAR